MRCFYHPDVDAVGICSACNRGLCSDCLVEAERGLACKNRCEAEVRRLLDLRDFSFAMPTQQTALLAQTKRAYQRSALFFLVMGTAFLAVGYYDPTTVLMPIMGAVFTLYGCWNMFRGYRTPRSDQFRLCPKCGYNITGNSSGKCPECGQNI